MIKQYEIEALEEELKRHECECCKIPIAKSFLEDVVAEYKDNENKINTAYEKGRNVGIEEAFTWNKGNEENSYNEGLKDAWELVKKMINKDWIFADARDCFGLDINFKTGAEVTREIFNIPYHEALAKFEAYEKEKEIKAGDVVRLRDFPSCEILITATSRGLNGFHLQTDNLGRIGEVNSGICKENIEKTGKHIDISAILTEIGKE